jgi:hypothetical protein
MRREAFPQAAIPSARSADAQEQELTETLSLEETKT